MKIPSLLDTNWQRELCKVHFCERSWLFYCCILWAHSTHHNSFMNAKFKRAHVVIISRWKATTFMILSWSCQLSFFKNRDKLTIVSYFLQSSTIHDNMCDVSKRKNIFNIYTRMLRCSMLTKPLNCDKISCQHSIETNTTSVIFLPSFNWPTFTIYIGEEAYRKPEVKCNFRVRKPASSQ